MRSSTGFVQSGSMFFAVALQTIMFSSAVRAGNFNTSDKVEVHHTAGKGLLVFDTPYDHEIGGKLDEAVGMVLEGPVFYSDHNRWKIRWEDGLEGWSTEDYLSRKDFPISPTFSISNKIETYNIGTCGLKVRTDPPELAEKGKVYDGTPGIIKGGPFYGVAKGSSGLYYFWKVEYDDGMVGWSAEPWLKGVRDPNIGIQPEKGDEALRSFTELPDLSVDEIWIEPEKFDPGETVEIFTKIKNTGRGDVVSYLGLCIKGYFDGRECYEETIEGLSAGAHTDDALHWSYSWPSDTKQHRIRIEVDPNNHIPESDENNNDFSSPFSALSTTNWALFVFLWLGLFGMGYLFLVSTKMRRMAKGIEALEGKMEHLEAVLLERVEKEKL